MKLRRQTIRIVTPLRWEALNGCNDVGVLRRIHSARIGSGVLGQQTLPILRDDAPRRPLEGMPALQTIEESLVLSDEGQHLRQAAEPDFNPDVNWWRAFEMGRLT